MKTIKYENSFGYLFPEKAKFWHPTKNGDLTPFNVYPGSGKKVWWKCDKNDKHEWIAPIDEVKRGRKCAVCAGRQVVRESSFGFLYPEDAKLWHPIKNGDLTPFDFSPGSGKIMWWQCSKNKTHEWQSSIEQIKRGRGCPYCSGKRLTLDNSFGFLYPERAKL
jgi:hypothetical protein